MEKICGPCAGAGGPRATGAARELASSTMFYFVPRRDVPNNTNTVSNLLYLLKKKWKIHINLKILV